MVPCGGIRREIVLVEARTDERQARHRREERTHDGCARLQRAEVVRRVGHFTQGRDPACGGGVVQVLRVLIRIRGSEHPPVAPFAPELDLGPGGLDRAPRVDVLVGALLRSISAEHDEVRDVIRIPRQRRAERAREAVGELDFARDNLLRLQVHPRHLRRSRIVVLVDAGRAERLAHHDLEIARLVGPHDERGPGVERGAEV